MSNQGFIKLYRPILEWEWYDDANTMRVFIHCLLKANHKLKQWHGIEVKRGSFITSYEKMAKELRLSRQKIITSIKKLKSTGEITCQTTNRYTAVTLVNYDFYQDRESLLTPKVTRHPTIKQQTDNIQISTNKNEKNEKNEKKVKTMGVFDKTAGDDDFNIFYNSGIRKKNPQEAKKAFSKQVKLSGLPAGEFAKALAKDIKERLTPNQPLFDLEPFWKLHPTTYLNKQRWNNLPPESLIKNMGPEEYMELCDAAVDAFHLAFPDKPQVSKLTPERLEHIGLAGQVGELMEEPDGWFEYFKLSNVLELGNEFKKTGFDYFIKADTVRKLLEQSKCL